MWISIHMKIHYSLLRDRSLIWLQLWPHNLWPVIAYASLLLMLLWPLAEACVWGWPQKVAAEFGSYAVVDLTKMLYKGQIYFKYRFVCNKQMLSTFLLQKWLLFIKNIQYITLVLRFFVFFNFSYEALWPGAFIYRQYGNQLFNVLVSFQKEIHLWLTIYEVIFGLCDITVW